MGVRIMKGRSIFKLLCPGWVLTGGCERCRACVCVSVCVLCLTLPSEEPEWMQAAFRRAGDQTSLLNTEGPVIIIKRLFHLIKHQLVSLA